MPKEAIDIHVPVEPWRADREATQTNYFGDLEFELLKAVIFPRRCVVKQT